MLEFLMIISGGWFGKWLDDTFKNEKENQTLGFVSTASDLKMSAGAFDFIADFEKFEPKAYKVRGESFYTIGFGSTRIFSKDGKTSRAVNANDVLTLDQAKFHMQMYYNSPNSPKLGIDNIIKSRGFKLNQRFYDMLCQFSYASGSFHRKASFQSQYIGMLQKANGSNDLNMLGDLLKNTWVAYLKQNANYTLYGLGWSRRAYAGAQYVKGLNSSSRYAGTQIKRPF